MNATKPHRHKCRRPAIRFSVAALLGFIAVLALPCAWLGGRVHKKTLEDQVIRRIADVGGEVVYDFEAGDDRSPPMAAAPGPAWLRATLGEHFCSEVIGVRFTAATVDAEAVRCLGVFVHLRELRFEGCEIPHDAFAQLCAVRHIQGLLFIRAPFDDRALEQVGAMIGLKRLAIPGWQVSRGGFAILSRLTHLRELVLSDTPISDAELVHLEELRELEDVWLFSTHVSSAGVERLQRAIPNCRIHH
jgi:hypothetical protein